jgi:hydrogenase maturation protein HypF
VQLVPVQHHHAHVVSVMAELGLRGPAIGVSYDGTGYGADGTIWGGEILIADRRGFQRAYHLRPVPLPGGEASITHPTRIALAYLIDSLGPSEADRVASDFLPSLTSTERRIVLRQIERTINAPLCSSMGRLFDAVGALLGASGVATYEGQPAMELESIAAGAGCQAAPYSYTIDEDMIDPRPMLREIATDLKHGRDRALIAARFHETVAAFTTEVCARVSQSAGLKDVVLSGGVMQNARLLSSLLDRLAETGLHAHIHKEVPPNDGGLSLGQAVAAAAGSDH